MKLSTTPSLFVPSCCRLLALFAASALLLTAAGCGDDTGVTGPTVVDQDATGSDLDGALTGSDGALLGQDGATLDVAIVGSDAATTGGDDATVVNPTASCAGKCGVYDKKAACQCDDKCTANGDCCTDYQAQCGTVANTCGDGKCVAPETVASCPADCHNTPAGSCSGQCGVYDKNAVCQCDDKCTANGDCCGDYQAQCGTVANTCGDGKCVAPETSATCPGDCGTVTNPSCGDGKCVPPEDTTTCPADCGTLPNSCGDGKCVAPETATSCPADCGTTSPIVSCVETNCATEVATCTADAACAKVLDCAKSCTDQNCLMGCVGGPGGFGNLPAGLTGVYNCGNKANCFNGGGTGPTTPVCGNGKCETGETTANCPKDCTSAGAGNSCVGLCGKLNTSGGFGGCQCQSWCTQAGNCCSDYQSVCGGGTTTPKCGNGVCETGETAANCPADCSGGGTTTTPDQCIQAKCSSQYAGCAKDPACLSGLACIEGGKQIWNCVTDWQVGLTLGQVQGCAVQNKCM